ncbi:hypothetical protein L218DRAFT_958780 [Marasmius fiardii PR-910]|nr:hypothetical protein L218DRAFT_958780 [Marasmius fiardii PR-910]
MIATGYSEEYQPPEVRLSEQVDPSVAPPKQLVDPKEMGQPILNPEPSSSRWTVGFQLRKRG